MDVSQKRSDEQQALWNGTAGQAWVEAQDTLDQMLKPFEDLLVEAAAAEPRTRVLDVGCGTGSTTLAIETRLNGETQCVGVDLSQPMLERARMRAEQAGAAATFVCADAERYPFERASFDLFVSRFGVMFFADALQAFQNLRRAARDGAELCFIAWRSAAENPFMTTAERAAAALLPSLPPRDPDAPGQFAFSDSNRVARLLADSGWSEVDVRPLDVQCSFAEKDLLRYVTRMGPLGRVLQQADEPTKERILAVVRPAFEPYVQGATVRFGAACWRISARCGTSR